MPASGTRPPGISLFWLHVVDKVLEPSLFWYIPVGDEMSENNHCGVRTIGFSAEDPAGARGQYKIRTGALQQVRFLCLDVLPLLALLLVRFCLVLLSMILL